MSRRNVIRQIQRECRSESIRHRNLQLPQVGQRRAGQVGFIAFTSLFHSKRLINSPSLYKNQSRSAKIYYVERINHTSIVQGVPGGTCRSLLYGMIKDPFRSMKIGITIFFRAFVLCLCKFCIFRNFLLKTHLGYCRTPKLYTPFLQFVKNSSIVI